MYLHYPSLQIINVSYCNEDSSATSIKSPFLLDLTKEERPETDHQDDDDNSNSTELPTSPSDTKATQPSIESPKNCEFWSVARLSLDRKLAKSLSPVPLTSVSALSNINPASASEQFSNRITSFYRPNEPGNVQYTDGFSKHFHYMLNRHHYLQPVDNTDRMGLITQSPDLGNHPQPNST